MQDSLTQKQLRKYRNTLIISGIGVIAFGIWSILKAVINLLSDLGSLNSELQDYEAGNIIAIIVYALIALLLSLDLWLRIYVGMSARAEGLGRKKSSLYLVLTAVLAVLSAISFIIFLISAIASGGVINTIVSMIVEGTAIFVMVQLIVSAIRVRQLTKAAAEQTGSAVVQGQH